MSFTFIRRAPDLEWASFQIDLHHPSRPNDGKAGAIRLKVSGKLWGLAFVGISQNYVSMDQAPERFSLSELLGMYVLAQDELQRREIVRTSNSPTGDLAEHLFCKEFGWKLAANNKKGYDASDTQGHKYEIKARRITERNRSRQLSAIRDLDSFHFLAGCIFDHDYRVIRAAIIPAEIVAEHASFVKRTNSYKFFLRDNIWLLDNVQDVTTQLQTKMSEIS